MRVVHVSEADYGGGANRATYRLHRALATAGVESAMLVGRKGTDDPGVQVARSGSWGNFKASLYPYLNVLPVKLYRTRQPGTFSSVWSCYGAVKAHPLIVSADVVCLCWVAGGFISPGDLRGLRKPIVWRLSDLWPFTGGCHYPGSCSRYEMACGRCPLLGSQREWDLSRLIYRTKRKALKELDITVVAPSRWIADCARRSSLFRDRRVEIIPTGVDLSVYRPIDQVLARSLLGLPQDSRLILFGALGATDDPRKGFVPLMEALGHLRIKPGDDSRLVVFGGPPVLPSHMDLPLPSIFIGRLTDDINLALLYSAADVLVAPYLEDNLPNVALEALACGTPVVAFDSSGMPDIVDHQRNGYLARAFDPEDLALGIGWCLESGRRSALRKAAREKAETTFSLTASARRYESLFRELADRPSMARS